MEVLDKNQQSSKQKDIKADSYEAEVISDKTKHLNYVPKPHGTIGQQITPDTE
ncbi:hypothetical protein [Mesobacillus harenae]|uniref:hypothetical protein n=1 Tax=Mesobacillus harenae TaxID=2213203 RepID=UPI001580DE1F|nr:hypothetical protein [Mesobacillus harenae]